MRRQGVVIAGLALGAFLLAAAWQLADPIPGPVPALVIDSAQGAAAQLLPGVVPESTAVPLAANVTGRTAPASSGPGFRHEWPAMTATARFAGDSVLVAFDDPLNRYRVTVDAAGPVLTLTRPGRAVLRLSGLGPGPHDIRAETLNEPPGPATFGGFFVPAPGTALPPPLPPPRTILFIGDSDTVGYGNTATSRDCSEEQVFLTTDTGRAFGPRVAGHFGAGYRIIARSGIGLVRNYDGGDPGRPMPALYALALPGDPAIPAAAADAGIIVVALGSNDVSTPLRAGEAWADAAALRADVQKTLLAFLRDRQRENPAAGLVVLAFGEYGDDLLIPTRAAVDAVQADGTPVLLVVLPELARTACHWHPSLADHALIADRLIAAIAAQPGLWGTAARADEPLPKPMILR